MSNAILQPSNGLARMRKRFLIVSVAALAVLGTSLGVSFTADTGVTQITATTPGSDLPLVWSANYTIGAGNGGLPAAITGSAGTGWKYGTNVGGVSSKPTAPGWGTVTTNVAGTVATSGDITVIDATTATSTNLLVTVYITNMHELSQTYNSYAMPIRVYSGVSATLTPAIINWGLTPTPITDVNLLNTANSYLTNNAGYETFKLVTGPNQYYEITLDTGGSYFPYQATPNGVSNTPALYITAQRTS
jgi:hypothetical protein